MADKIKQIGEKDKVLTGASGTKYIVHSTLTVAGYEKLEELKIQMQVGNSAADLLKMLQVAYDVLNKGKFADTAVHLYNCINIAERIEDDRHPAWLLMLTLFLRPEGSDLAVWDEETAGQWIDDLNAAGYDAAGLFSLASIVTKEYAFFWQHNSHATSTDPNDQEEGSGAVGAASVMMQ